MSKPSAPRTFQFLGYGRQRVVFRCGAWVVKVPLSDYGIHDNHYERRTWVKCRERGYVRYAACRLIGDILVMRYVKPVYGVDEPLPVWVDAVDCQQVGRAPDGRLLAFDYGWF